MTYEGIMNALEDGKKVRLPEWRGYWFMDEDGEVLGLTKEGDIVIPWISENHTAAHRLALQQRTDWEIAEGLDFGWAICALKAGKLVTRKGWNGKGMFLFIRPEDELDVDFIVEKVKSLPQSLKNYYAKRDPWMNEETGVISKSQALPNSKVKFTSYICMKAADGTMVNGWLASQTDMLAEDWQLFDS
ncbi:DUF2829 domain-containing protein [Mongoliibacter ruber]|uniref:Uncharacterized protein DUF2829 n=1 Tax=Mongoliibacter ruber TaxID=1750599 RepID=A0A2T0WVJ2_9BACT|nr:DUF2829 domain-containing protein [Mongoliibacter ruber]PRY90604.1 uncharacterized protein DUF2829 [Mongoliibacter ruber]